MESFGARLRRHRHAAGLSIEELAAASGVSVRTIGDMERGRSRRPQARTWALLAQALGLDPAESSLFVGRDAELARLDELARQESGAVAVLAGPAGVGKTALAVQATRRLAERFPDGSHIVDLRGMDESTVGSGEALTRLLHSFGVGPRDVPDDLEARSGLYRTVVRDRRALVVLDNAADERQVRPMLHGDAATMTLITSRRVLAGLERVDRVHLDTLALAEATTLLGTILNDRAGTPSSLERVAQLCDRLPLALRIAGNRLASRPEWDLDTYAVMLGDEQRRLGQLSAGDRGVAAALELSYRQLSPAAARVFRRLALAPGPDAGVELVEALAALPSSDVEEALDELVDLGLLHASASAELRFGFHDLVRLYARERVAEEEDSAALTDGMVSWLLDTATAAGERFQPSAEGDSDPAAAQRWLQAEGENWLGALRLGAASGRHESVLRTAEAMHWFSERWTYWTHWHDVFGLGRDSAVALGDQVGESTQLNYLSWAAAVIRQRPDLAIGYAEQALAIAGEAGDDAQQGWALRLMAELHQMSGDLATAETEAERALRHLEAAGESEGAVTALNALGMIARKLGRPAEALDRHLQVRAILDDPDQIPALIADVLRAGVQLNLGRAWIDLGDWPAATEALRLSVDLARRDGVLHMESFALEGLADAYLGAGDPTRAADALRESLTLMEAAGQTNRADHLRQRLRNLPG